jgi:hypothetical protein
MLEKSSAVVVKTMVHSWLGESIEKSVAFASKHASKHASKSRRKALYISGPIMTASVPVERSPETYDDSRNVGD